MGIPSSDAAIHCRVARSSTSGHSGSRSKFITKRSFCLLAVSTDKPAVHSESRVKLELIFNEARYLKANLHPRVLLMTFNLPSPFSGCLLQNVFSSANSLKKQKQKTKIIVNHLRVQQHILSG